MKLNKLMNLRLIILELFVVIIAISAALAGDNVGVAEMNKENKNVENIRCISDAKKIEVNIYILG